LQFDGVDDYVNCGNDDRLNFGTGSFSATFWFNTTLFVGGYGNGNAIIGKKSTAYAYYAGYHINVSAGKLCLQLADGTNYISGQLLRGTSTVNDGNWHFGAVVADRSAGIAYIYVDGLPDASISIENITGSIENTYNTIIGAGAGGGHHPFEGSLGNIAIYDRALTPAEIVQNYQATIIPVTDVSLDKSVLLLKEGTSAEPLAATIEPANATNKGVTWASDNPDVATVDENGKVTAEAPGVAKITATTGDGARKQFAGLRL
jgi:uncharacterized protein YjdB